MVKKAKSLRSTAKKAVKKGVAVKSSPRKAVKVKSTISSKKAKEITIPPVAKVTKPFTKSELFATLAGRTGFQRKEIAAVMNELQAIVVAHLKKNGPQKFMLPGLIKMKTVDKPATKARMGTNPFTKEPMKFKAKPARRVVKAVALKLLKEMV